MVCMVYRSKMVRHNHKVKNILYNKRNERRFWCKGNLNKEQLLDARNKRNMSSVLKDIRIPCNYSQSPKHTIENMQNMLETRSLTNRFLIRSCVRKQLYPNNYYYYLNMFIDKWIAMQNWEQLFNTFHKYSCTQKVICTHFFVVVCSNNHTLVRGTLS